MNQTHLEDTINIMVRHLLDERIKTIALSGSWGIGKTYLWHEISKSIENSKIIYTSVFGAKSVENISAKILYQGIPSLKNDKTKILNRWAKVVASTTKDILAPRLNIESSAEFLLPDLIKNKIIVLDDLERIDEKLSLTQVLGFVRNLSDKYNAKFVIILNKDKVKEQKTWETYEEKTIDIVVGYQPTSEYCIEIANQIYKPNIMPEDLEILNDILKVCKIKNIRFINKIYLFIEEIFPKTTEERLNHYNLLPVATLLYLEYYNQFEENSKLNFENIKNFNPTIYNQHDDLNYDSGFVILSKFILKNDKEFCKKIYECINKKFVDKNIKDIFIRFNKYSESLETSRLLKDIFISSYLNPDFHAQDVVDLDNYLVKNEHENLKTIDSIHITSLEKVYHSVDMKKEYEELLNIWINSQDFDSPIYKNRNLHSICHEKIEQAIARHVNNIHMSYGMQDFINNYKNGVLQSIDYEFIKKYVNSKDIYDYLNSTKNLELAYTIRCMIFSRNNLETKSLYSKFEDAYEMINNDVKNMNIRSARLLNIIDIELVKEFISIIKN